MRRAMPQDEQTGGVFIGRGENGEPTISRQGANKIENLLMAVVVDLSSDGHAGQTGADSGRYVARGRAGGYFENGCVG